MSIGCGWISKPCPQGGDAALPTIVDAVAARCRAILAGLNDMDGVK
jgi:hypothetical protein